MILNIVLSTCHTQTRVSASIRVGMRTNGNREMEGTTKETECEREREGMGSVGGRE